MPHLNMNPASLSPLALFLHADWIVKGVMLGLLLASFWSWSIIFQAWRKLREEQQRIDTFFEETRDMSDTNNAAFADASVKARPISEMYHIAGHEWNASRSYRRAASGLRDRTSILLNSYMASYVDALSKQFGILATIGAIAPFVGLFGTVWGIMSAFTGIASAQNTNLAVVAPGIAEALFATALGLFAAIPAVIAYNRLGHMADGIDASLTRVADLMLVEVSRKIDIGDSVIAQGDKVVRFNPIQAAAQ